MDAPPVTKWPEGGATTCTVSNEPLDNLRAFANVLGGLSLAFEAAVDAVYPGAFRPAGRTPEELGAGCGLGGAGAGPATTALL